MTRDTQKNWEAYRAQALDEITPALKKLGYELDAEQPHTQGERSVIQAVGGGRKLVLLGRAHDGTRVVVKAASESEGIRELEHERTCRAILERIHFAYGEFFTPAELFFGQRDGFTLAITEFIEQDVPFLERPIEEQFAIALAAFKAQESAHATAHSHFKLVRGAFGAMDAAAYCASARSYVHAIGSNDPTLLQALALLENGRETLDRYGSFLTHWDFVPQNFRIRAGKLYLLDHSSLRFGNKYEGWARFVNFMELYNPPLANALVRYVADNRTPEEFEALKLMRVYRLLELVLHHSLLLAKTTGNLHALSAARVMFWTEVLRHVLDETRVPEQTVGAYQTQRDALRSEDEKRRQKGLH